MPTFAVPHEVRLVDPAGAPFGCVDLETTHHVRFRTDAGGVAAVYEPGLDGPVWFTPVSGSAVAPVDWLGVAGFAVTLVDGGSTEIVLERASPEGPCDEGDRGARLVAHGVPTPAEHHRFHVTDAQTGAAVPAVRLSAGGREWWTDNGGNIALFDLDHQDASVEFAVWTHGYTHDPGTIEVVPAPGGTTEVQLDRVNLAQRSARLTGGGTWRDTVLLGLPTPVDEPLLDSQVVGQDTAHATPFRGELFWLWGDTARPSYPLGNFHAAGATASLGDDPVDGVDFAYFEDATGFTAGIAPTFAANPVWLSGLVALDDAELWSTYANVAADFSVAHAGMARWDDGASAFVPAVEWTGADPVQPAGPAMLTAASDGRWVVYEGLARVPADPASMADPSTYQAWTPRLPDGTWSVVDGVLDWQWRVGVAPPIDGELPDDDSPWAATWDPDTGERPLQHGTTTAFVAARGRWVRVFTESWGSSSLIGELWYTEGDTPVGPWTWARKVVTHDGYSFYNPYLHWWRADRAGQRLWFEGTYTAWLGDQPPTPRHDYNQFAYALDLDDPALALPVPLYDGPTGPVTRHDAVGDAPIAFGALDRPGEDHVAVAWTAPSCDPDRALVIDGPGEIAFWAMPPGDLGPGRADLAPWTRPDGSRVWSTRPVDGGVAGAPVATVWEARWAPPVPLSTWPLADRADAGPDRCGVGSPLTLDGTGSVATGGIASWSWSWAGGAASGPTPTIELPPGLHVVTLAATRPDGVVLSDTVALAVVASPQPTDTGSDGTTGDTGGPADDPTEPPEGCGCASGRPSGGWVMVVLAGWRRRCSRKWAACRPVAG